MSSQGFGICGHRNSFSTGVRCGNWIEDTFGADLAQKHRAKGTFSYAATKSEAQEHFMNDHSTTDRKSLIAGTQYDQRAKLTGLPLHLLMGHDGADGPNSMYISSSDMMHAAQPSKFKRHTREGVTRAKNIRDATPHNGYATQTGSTTREATIKFNRTDTQPYTKPSGDENRQELTEVPKERRHTNFLSTFKAGIPGLRK
jgi:hypothetical protein